MSPTKGQKRPMGSGGETSKSKDSRAASAQASTGTKRPPENERPDDIDQCLMNLIVEDRRVVGADQGIGRIAAQHALADRL